MKKFHFPLDRVLAWRQTLVRLEQVKLERLFQELRQVQDQAALLLGEQESVERSVIHASSTLGLELAAFESFRKASATRSAALKREGSACLEKIRSQREVISLKERNVRLLEKLREDRWRAWGLEENREVDQQAEEGYLGRWRSRSRHSPVP